ncbi:hypothetical protein Desor_2783 [Desulfosporosinus orientis DSM 765]|uniref:Uncharacterized protein n=1 Tax=Desulfosporosinus orientis (strain ATCC 19365 / DSM 765 / NCIMB 8382 / VKM B-1628 / Singapore I) TaxID=768706 RepID=G7WDJ6_DESOD|nr:hypothetical protein [Desulfosporosinus orientis]AET68321.1 hypothetical protein Desor_2783 [Desulfosporosinus orientis DSM 765]
MSEEILKQLVNFKFSLVHKVVERLPETIQKPIKGLEGQLMQTLYDISKEFVEKTPVGETDKTGGLRTIDVE